MRDQAQYFEKIWKQPDPESGYVSYGYRPVSELKIIIAQWLDSSLHDLQHLNECHDFNTTQWKKEIDFQLNNFDHLRHLRERLSKESNLVFHAKKYQDYLHQLKLLFLKVPAPLFWDHSGYHARLAFESKVKQAFAKKLLDTAPTAYLNTFFRKLEISDENGKLFFQIFLQWILNHDPARVYRILKIYGQALNHRYWFRNYEIQFYKLLIKNWATWLNWFASKSQSRYQSAQLIFLLLFKQHTLQKIVLPYRQLSDIQQRVSAFDTKSIRLYFQSALHAPVQQPAHFYLDFLESSHPDLKQQTLTLVKNKRLFFFDQSYAFFWQSLLFHQDTSLRFLARVTLFTLASPNASYYTHHQQTIWQDILKDLIASPTFSRRDYTIIFSPILRNLKTPLTSGSYYAHNFRATIYGGCVDCFADMPMGLQQQVLALGKLGVHSHALIQLFTLGVDAQEESVKLTAFKFYADHVKHFLRDPKQVRQSEVKSVREAWQEHFQQLQNLASHIQNTEKTAWSVILQQEAQHAEKAFFKTAFKKGFLKF